MTFTGTIANINTALNGLSLRSHSPTTTAPPACRSSPTTRATRGSGGTLTDTDTVNITVNAVNDAPVNTVPGPQSTNEDTALVFSAGNGNPIRSATWTPAAARCR